MVKVFHVHFGIDWRIGLGIAITTEYINIDLGPLWLTISW